MASRLASARGRRVFEEGSGRANRTESPSTTRSNRFTKTDDKDEHLDDKGREEGNEEETASTRTRIKKDTGARSRGDDDDDDNDDKEGDDDAPKKSQKKTGAAGGAKNRRKEKKNLREKRRATGVVIMPGQPADPNDEAAQAVAANTAANLGADAADDGSGSGGASAAEIMNYQETISQLQDELAAKVKEIEQVRSQIDTLQKQNTRYKDENSALLRVVGSLSGTGGAPGKGGGR